MKALLDEHTSDNAGVKRFIGCLSGTYISDNADVKRLIGCLSGTSIVSWMVIGYYKPT